MWLFAPRGNDANNNNSWREKKATEWESHPSEVKQTTIDCDVEVFS